MIPGYIILMLANSDTSNKTEICKKCGKTKEFCKCRLDLSKKTIEYESELWPAT